MYAELYSSDFYQTQYELIKSHTLAERVARDMNITSFAQLFPDKKPSFSEQFFGAKVVAADEPPQVEPVGTFEPEHFAGTVRGGLTVRPVKNSRLVHLSYDSQSPQFAANAVNSYARNFMEMNLDRRIEDASYAQSFLAEQIKQARANLEDSEPLLCKIRKS